MKNTPTTPPTPPTPDTGRCRELRREVPSTVGLLADAGDFAAMRDYASFAFDHRDDYADYLHHMDAVLRSLTAQGIHTTVALFDPEEYADYCADHGLDPDSAGTRTRFTAELAAGAGALPYTGQPIEELAPLLVDEAVRQATWEYATMLLAGAGTCADCGEDIGRSSLERATHILRRLITGAGPGHHHLVCSIPAEEEQLVAVLHAQVPDDPGAGPRVDGREGLDFTTVLAAGIALGGAGGLVLRSTTEGFRDRVHGWRLDGGRLVTLTAAAVFDAYCTDADTGDPVAPEPGVEYCPGYEVDTSGPHH
ncbi:hypothetical protein OOK31_29635 [Streptomyces sp. NBC_00249]|uniref:hypothetical protein n=1 Tax=Streptomyces sp. NBC_00249 TaxID=2975690 RepID=UPI00225C0EEC|nr:hypothetical protein [Streptomyces sp. NBC_00249]MCX5198006.1 hypothetical protein [Streptomyces sp. NBC_00249]